MASISGKETKPEILIRSILFRKGFRFRKNVKKLPGTPDIVLSKYKAAIFIHGCFWHGHSCRAARLPKTRTDFWKKKIGKNKLRDNKDVEELIRSGWKVIIVWQCEIKNKMLLKKRIEKLEKQILKSYHLLP